MSDESRTVITATSVWQIDANGFLLTTSGAKVARVAGQVIMLYDKRTGTEVPLTLADYHAVQTQTLQGEP